jgi:hypothetical protein
MAAATDAPADRAEDEQGEPEHQRDNADRPRITILAMKPTMSR